MQPIDRNYLRQVPIDVVGTLVHLFLRVRRLDALRPIDGTPGFLAKFLAIVVVTGPVAYEIARSASRDGPLVAEDRGPVADRV